MARVTASDRRKYGDRKGKYPLRTKAQCISAIRLRHHGKGVSASTVLDRVARRAAQKGWKDIQAKVRAARARDRKR